MCDQETTLWTSGSGRCLPGLRRTRWRPSPDPTGLRPFSGLGVLGVLGVLGCAPRKDLLGDATDNSQTGGQLPAWKGFMEKVNIPEERKLGSPVCVIRRCSFRFGWRCFKGGNRFGKSCCPVCSRSHGQTFQVVRWGDGDSSTALLRQVHCAHASHGCWAENPESENS